MEVQNMNINTYKIRFNNDRIGELVKENTFAYSTDDMLIDSPEKVAKLIESLWDASNLAQEHFWLLALDGARRVAGAFTVTIGTLVSSLVHPREVFQRAILSGAASIIIAHNHPSGQLDISEQDREVTRRIRKAGDLLGIRLDDHVVVAGGDFVSAY
jgi:DNA repair protein RadC